MVKQNQVTRWFFLHTAALLLGLASLPTRGMAGVHFTLQSAVSDNTVILITQNSRSASASVAVDLGTHFSIGVTHRQTYSKVEGYKLNEYTNQFYYIREQNLAALNSLDFNIILFYGQLFVPYLQLGLAKKSTTIRTEIDHGEVQAITSAPRQPLPNGGIGLGIRLNQNFSLKLSYLVSPSVRVPHPKAIEGESVLDAYTSIGVTYNI